VWEQVINHILKRKPDAVILADTLGMTESDAGQMQEALRECGEKRVYDLCYDDAGRTWDFKDAIVLKQARAKRTEAAAQYGTLGFIDSHDFIPRAADYRKFYADTRDTVADVKIAMQCLRDYAVACFTNNSMMLPRGFQWCIENNSGVFREQVTVAFFQKLKAERKAVPSALNIGPALAEMHRLRAQLPHDVKVNISNTVTTDSAYLSALQCDFHDRADDRILASIILLFNIAPQHGAQKFPETWWRGVKEKQSNAQRIQFGPDRKNPAGITGVAVLVVPGDAMAKMAFVQRQAPAQKPGEELTLVA
jgi:hypothetical protein